MVSCRFLKGISLSEDEGLVCKSEAVAWQGEALQSKTLFVFAHTLSVNMQVCSLCVSSCL